MPDQTPQKPIPQPEELPQAHPHHKYKGKVVRTAFGEPMPGAIADITDGED
jgi:hypothetical protein